MNKFMLQLFIGLTYMLIFTASVSLAQEVAPAAEVCSGLLCQVMGNFPEINAWIIAVFTFIGLMLRASADLLGFVSKQLKKSDNGWAQRLGDYAVYCASVVGWFGGGTPKVVLDKKVAKAVAAAPQDAPK